MLCPQCQTSNGDDARFCSQCGYSLNQGIYEPPRAAELELPADGDALYKAMIGIKNQDYYLRRFVRFDERGGAGVSWHWPALFVAFYWFLYRKMWLYAAAYFFLPYVFMLMGGIVAGILVASIGKLAGPIIGVADVIFFIAMLVVVPMYANALYYRHCRGKLAEIKAATSDPQQQLAMAYARGGTSGGVFFIILLFVGVAIIGILAAIAIPQYQAYTLRAHTEQALQLGRRASAAVEAYYDSHHAFPVSLQQANFNAALPPDIESIKVAPNSGAIGIMFSARADILAGKSLFLEPTLSGGHFTWQCTSMGIQTKYLPAACRE